MNNIPNIQFHFLKEDFMSLAFKHRITTKLLEGYEDRNGVNDGMLTLMLNFEAPGEQFGIETKDVIRHYWQLINIIDGSFNLFEFDLETKKTKPMKDVYFIFNWLGEIRTETTLAINDKVFLELMNLLISQNPNNPTFNHGKLKRTRIINKYY